MIFDGIDGIQLGAYSDSDWAGDLYDQKSTTSSYIMIAGGPVLWKSIKQTGVSLLSTEAEYIAALETAKNVIIIRGILIKLGIIDDEFSFPLMINNAGSIAISNGEKVTQNAYYIEIRYHHIWDLVQKRTIELLQIPSNEMVADGLMKMLKIMKFREFRNLLGLHLKTQAEIEFTDNRADNRTDNRADEELD